jgi:hypothetical protein
MRVLYTRGPLLGPVIRRFSAVPVDHCGIVIAGRVWDVAMFSPVQARTIDDWLDMRGRRLVYDITVPLADEIAGELAVMRRAGRGYDYGGPALIPFQIDADDPSRDYCTELPNHYIRAAEPVLMPPRRGRWDVGASLGLLWALARARGGPIVVHAS